MQGFRDIEGYHNKCGSKDGIVLTPRETEILQLVAQGKGNKEIGDCLGISLPTVKVHLANIFEKLGVSRRMEAVALLCSEPYWQRARAS